MGAFYLVCEPDPVRRERVVTDLGLALADQGFTTPETVRFGSTVAAAYGKLNGTPAQFQRTPDGRFALIAGTALIEGTVGAAAAQRLLDHEPPGAGTQGPSIIGDYCIVHGNRERSVLRTDPMGIYKVYTDREQQIFCSSFLAIATALKPVSANPQGVYEYAHQEATYGGDTVLNEVRLARNDGRYLVHERTMFEPVHDDWEPRIEDRPMAEHLQGCLAQLREQYARIAACFGDRVDTALSGGYDSRLTLALLREQGLSPHVHVYGGAASPDVRVARDVSAGESFHLDHTDKSLVPAPSRDAYPEIVARNFRAFDGWPPAGIFDGGADLASRQARAGAGRLMLNGGGGEVFRNFFYLLNRRLSAREVIWSFYSRYVPQWCAAPFREADYVARLEEKLRATVRTGGRLRREQVEYLYPAFRCRFWMGRNNSLNSRLGWALTPFVERDLVRLAVAVPLRYKNHGRLEAAMIRKVSPSLAAYGSDYGHAFDADPPLRRVLKDYLTLARPPWLRRFSYRVRYRRPHPRPELLQDHWLRSVMDPDLPLMQHYFRVERINDPGAFARVATLEYLFRTLGVSS